MKISIKKILIFFLMLYPVLPVNYYLGNFSYANLCSIIIIFLYCCTVKQKKILNIFKYNTFFWIYLILYSIFAITTSNILIAFAWIISTLCVSIVIIDLVKNKNDFDLIIEGIIASSVILSIIGIIEAFSKVYLIQGNLLNATENIRYGLLRATGPFGICINYGMYQSIGATMLLYKILNRHLNNRKLYILYFLIIFSVFLSVSRLAICMLFAIQALLYCQIGITKKSIKNLLIIIIIISILLILLDSFGLEVFKMIEDFGISFGELLGFSAENRGDDVVGFGNRTDLYEWVYDAIRGDFLFGKGIKTEFSYRLASWLTKTSIEVQYLYILYHCGFIGLMFLVLGYINTLKYFYMNKNLKTDEDNISFCKILFILFLIYYICLFGIQETDLTRIYCELVSLGISYVKIVKKDGIK